MAGRMNTELLQSVRIYHCQETDIIPSSFKRGQDAEQNSNTVVAYHFYRQNVSEKEQHMQDFIPGESRKNKNKAQGNSLFLDDKFLTLGMQISVFTLCDTIREAFMLV